MPTRLKDWYWLLVAISALLLLTYGLHAQPLRGGYRLPAPSPVKAKPVKPAPAKPVAPPKAIPLRLTYAQTVAHDLRYSASYLYLRELTGNNDAPEIDRWADATGTARRSSWCGLFQWAINTDRKGPVPVGAAGSYNWFRDRRTFYLRDQRGTLDSLKPADKVGFFYSNLGRIGHILLVVEATRGTRKGRAARGYVLRSGNTGRGGGRNGAGVYDLFYTAADIYAAARW